MNHAIDRCSVRLSLLTFFLALLLATAPAGAVTEIPDFGPGGLEIAGHPEGGWLVLSSDSETSKAIRTVRVAADGTVGATVTTQELHPIFVQLETAAVAPSGRWLAVWKPESQDFESTRFSAAIFEPDGELVRELDLSVAGEIFVNTDLRTAVVAIAPNGDFLLAWGARTDETESTYGTSFLADLFLARFAQDGDRVAGPVVVNQERVGLQLPRHMVVNDDSVAIAWSSNCCVEDGGVFEGHARFFDLSLSPKSDVIRVSGGPEMSRGASALAFRPDGRLVVVSRGMDTPEGGVSPVEVVLFRAFETDGTPAGPATAVGPASPGAILQLAEATAVGTVWLLSAEEPEGPLFAHLLTLEGTSIGQASDTGLREVPGRFFEAASDPRGRLLVGYAEFGSPAVVAPVPGQAPPDERALASPELPGYRVWVLFDGPSPAPRWGAEEPLCLAETLCASGAVPGRVEVLVRVVGPKPNGFLWPTLVKLSTSDVDVWIEQTSTGEVRHYFLPGASPGVDVLPGLFDRFGFSPSP